MSSQGAEHRARGDGTLDCGIQEGRGDDAPDSAGSATQQPRFRSQVGRALGARALALPVSAVLGLLTSSLIIRNFGGDVFGRYGLLTSLIGFLGFADLGVGAVLNNIFAGSRDRSSDHVVRTLVSVLRALTASFVVVAGLGLAVSLFGFWPRILGPEIGDVPDWTLSICVVLTGASVAFGLGQRLLVAVGMSGLCIVLQLIQPVLVVGGILALVGASWPTTLVYTLPFLALVLANVVITAVSLRVVGAPVKRAVGLAMQASSRGARIRHVALPMLVIMVASSLALQTDRVVLAHFGSLEDVARLTLATQFAAPVLSFIATASAAIWPVSASRRRDPNEIRVDYRPVLVVVGFTAPFAVAYILLGPWAASLLSHGVVQLPLLLVAATAGYIMAQSVQYPLGMMLTTPRALRFQAVCLAASSVFNLGLSIALAKGIGAAGPIGASAIATLLAQAVPFVIYARRNRATRE